MLLCLASEMNRSFLSTERSHLERFFWWRFRTYQPKLRATESDAACVGLGRPLQWASGAWLEQFAGGSTYALLHTLTD